MLPTLELLFCHPYALRQLSLHICLFGILIP
jgi:hypothetical protein